MSDLHLRIPQRGWSPDSVRHGTWEALAWDTFLAMFVTIAAIVIAVGCGGGGWDSVVMVVCVCLCICVSG